MLPRYVCFNGFRLLIGDCLLSTRVNGHFSPPFRIIICLELFPSIEEANPNRILERFGVFPSSFLEDQVPGSHGDRFFL